MSYHLELTNPARRMPETLELDIQKNLAGDTLGLSVRSIPEDFPCGNCGVSVS